MIFTVHQWGLMIFTVHKWEWMILQYADFQDVMKNDWEMTKKWMRMNGKYSKKRLFPE